MDRPTTRVRRAERWLALASLAGFLAATGACSSADETVTPEPTTAATAAPTSAPPPSTAISTTAPGPTRPGEVVIRDYEFVPPTTTVEVGGTVTWGNTDDVDHFVLSDDGTTVNSGHIPPGGSSTATFTTPGTFGYYCDIHNSMIGSVEVG